MNLIPPLSAHTSRAEPVGLDGWSPTSWQSRQALQQPEYPAAAALAAVLGQLGRLPPLVTSGEIDHGGARAARASLAAFVGRSSLERV